MFQINKVIRKNKKILFLSLLELIVFSNLFTQNNSDEPFQAIIPNNEDFTEFFLDELPKIEKLSSYQKDFQDYCQLIESNNRKIKNYKEPEIKFYIYENIEAFNLGSLSARCNLPYETIATLNKIESFSDDINAKKVILPSAPGLFICTEEPDNDLEILLKEENQGLDISKEKYFYKLHGKKYVFILNKRLSSTQRLFFLDSAMELPLEKGTFNISSEFGMRENPFSGKLKNHNGIDLAAKEGTPVRAVKDGNIAYVISNDKEFGNYLIVQHDRGKLTSVYAHLSRIIVEQYDNVKKGQIIAYVGHTGLATGDHLHFELRQGGTAENPREILKF